MPEPPPPGRPYPWQLLLALWLLLMGVLWLASEAGLRWFGHLRR